MSPPSNTAFRTERSFHNGKTGFTARFHNSWSQVGPLIFGMEAGWIPGRDGSGYYWSIIDVAYVLTI